MADVDGGIGLTQNIGSLSVGGIDAEQKISPLVTVTATTINAFTGSFDRNRLGITYNSNRKDAIRGDFNEESNVNQ